MDRIWSPWRSKHLARSVRDSGEERGSIFERIAEQDEDEENFILWRGEQVFIAMNRYPYNKAHLLVLPYRRVRFFDELTSEEQKALMKGVEMAINCVDDAFAPDGFHTGMNLGKAAGAGIPEHLHVHVVPRWKGDTCHLPAEGELDDLESAMRKTYARLREVI